MQSMSSATFCVEMRKEATTDDHRLRNAAATVETGS
jgi:hypothetical protein